MGPETSNNQIFSTSFQRHPNFRRPKLLPVELLVEVFLLSLPPLHCGQAQHRTSLALVCRLWNETIEGTPILWSRISFKDTSSYVKRSLRKSAKSPIDVYVVCSDREIEYCRDYTDSNSRLSWEGGWGCVVEEKHYGEPSLQAIGSLACRECRTLLTSSWAPRLRELVLDDIELAPRAMSSLPTLSRLVIQNSPMSPRQILTALAEFPNLTILRLSGCDGLGSLYRLFGSWVPDMSGGALGSTLVELASLRQLTFDNVDSYVIRDVLRRLKFPSDCKVSLKCELDGRDPKASFLDPALSQYHETFHAVGEIVRVSISLHSCKVGVILLQFLRWDIALELRHPPAALDILERFGISTNESAAASYSEKLPINPIRPFNDMPISWKPGNYSRSNWSRNPLLNLGCIGRIELASMTPEDYDKVLSYLSKPLVPPSPATTPTTTSQEAAGNSGSEVAMQHVAETWPVPGLCELALQSSEDHVLRAVMEFIKRRSASGVGPGHNRAASGRSPAAQLLAPLERVRFDGEDDKYPESECRRNLPSDVKAWPSALLDLLEILDDDVQVFWFGKRISKAGIMD